MEYRVDWWLPTTLLCCVALALIALVGARAMGLHRAVLHAMGHTGRTTGELIARLVELAAHPLAGVHPDDHPMLRRGVDLLRVHRPAPGLRARVLAGLNDWSRTHRRRVRVLRWVRVLAPALGVGALGACALHVLALIDDPTSVIAGSAVAILALYLLGTLMLTVAGAAPEPVHATQCVLHETLVAEGVAAISEGCPPEVVRERLVRLAGPLDAQAISTTRAA